MSDKSYHFRFSFFANVSPLLATFIFAACELDRFTFQDSSGHTPQWVDIPAMAVSLRFLEWEEAPATLQSVPVEDLLSCF